MNFSRQRIFLTGGNGGLGRPLTAELIKRWCRCDNGVTAPRGQPPIRQAYGGRSFDCRGHSRSLRNP